MNIRQILRIAVPGILFGLFLSASPSGTVVLHPVDSPRDTLRIRGFETSFQPRFDPAKGEMVFVTQQIFDGLVRLDDDLNIVPDLAEYWDISEGGRCYTFYLRKGIRFHNGRELSAADVKFSLLRLLRGESESPYGRHFIDKVVGAEDFAAGKTDDVTGFRILDPYIFEVKWRNPYVSALSLLSMSFCRILPQDPAETQGRGFFSHPIGTGPFKFDSWIRSPRLDIVGVRLVRNPAYFGRAPRVAAVEYSPYFTFDHFEQRDVDAMPYSADLARLGCQVVEGGDLNVSYLMMSCANAPFDRARVRRAMALVVDKDKIVQALPSEAVRFRAIHNFIPAKLPGFFPSFDPEESDPEQASRILEEEGYFRTKEFPEILLFTPDEGKIERTPFVRELTRQFEALDIHLKAKGYRNLDELKDVRQPFFVLWERGMDFPDAENVIEPLFGKSSAFRWLTSNVPGPGFDRLLEAAGLEAGRARRLDLFREMEGMIRRDVPGIPMLTVEQRLAVQPNIRGLRIPPLGAMYIDLREVAFVR
ncbi:MAG: ABC transporter substrate-binding protein [Candidatus Aminicenantes bacterium]|nr:ABC transporter substrate-binding protein [Candidatus Aminicenantes bacterium]